MRESEKPHPALDLYNALEYSDLARVGDDAPGDLRLLVLEYSPLTMTGDESDAADTIDSPAPADTTTRAPVETAENWLTWFEWMESTRGTGTREFAQNLFPVVAMILDDYAVRGVLNISSLRWLVTRLEPDSPSIFRGGFRLAGRGIDARSLLASEAIPWPPRNPVRVAAEQSSLPTKALAREAGVSRATFDRALCGEQRRLPVRILVAAEAITGTSAASIAMQYAHWRGDLRLTIEPQPMPRFKASEPYRWEPLQILEAWVLLDLAGILSTQPRLGYCANPDCRRLFVARTRTQRHCSNFGKCRRHREYVERQALD